MYDTTGFLEKNRDLLHLDSIQLLSSCTCHLPQAFASNLLTQSEKPVVGPLYKSGGADSQKLSVVSKFKVYKVMRMILIFPTLTIIVKKNIMIPEIGVMDIRCFDSTFSYNTFLACVLLRDFGILNHRILVFKTSKYHLTSKRPL